MPGIPSSYDEACAILAGGRDKSRRTVANNTRVVRRGDDVAVQLHGTDVVTFTRDGWAIIDHGGWDTVTTWARVNAALPGGYTCWSDRGRRNLYAHGTRTLLYAPGVAVRASDGALGYRGPDGTIAVLMTRDDVNVIRGAQEAADEARAEKRAARLLREHPVVGGPRTHRANLGWGGRPYGCARCETELDAEREARRAALAVEHEATAATLARNPSDADPWTDAEYAAAGSHVRREARHEWAMGPDGRPDYRACPARTWEEVRVACPWDCPKRGERDLAA